MNEPQSGGWGVAQTLRTLAFLGALLVLGWLLYTIRGTLLPFFIAFVLSYILMPLVDYIESHRINRFLAVAVILIGVLGVVLVPLRFAVPVLISGTEDMVQRFVGEQGIWSCVVANESQNESLQINKIESLREDFKVEGTNLPLVLAPGERDTLRVVFAPETENERVGQIRLSMTQGDAHDAVIRLRLQGNRQGLKDSTSTGRAREFVFGTVQVSLTDTTHVFGKYKPGYLAILKSYNRNLQKHIDASFPILNGADVAEYVNAKLQNIATNFLPEISELASQLLSGLTFVIIVPLVLFFFLGEGRAIKRTVIEMVPNQYFEMVLNLLYRIDIQLGGYIRGMVLSVLIISILSITGLYFVGLEYFLVIGTVAGIANVIPYLGPLIGIIAGIVAAAIQYSALSASIVVPVIVVFLIVQLFDNIFVAPVVVARSVNLHPLIVIFVVLVGSQLFGALGMLLAVPVTAVLKVSVQTIIEGLRSYSV